MNFYGTAAMATRKNFLNSPSSSNLTVRIGKKPVWIMTHSGFFTLLKRLILLEGKSPLNIFNVDTFHVDYAQ